MGGSSGQNERADPKKRKGRILILEDEYDILSLLRESLSFYGFEVDAFSDPDHAVNSFLTTPTNYDLVLMDFRLNGVDGKTIYKRFKKFDSAFKVCILTALNFDIPEFRKFCPSFEEKFLVKKPVKISSLVQTLSLLLD
ncbi:MAG TPA: response regulator [Nitrososphaeraceae archaeon]